MHRKHGRSRRVVAALALVALVAAACGGDDDDGGGAAGGETTTTGVPDAGGVEGCGEEAVTDPADASPDRAVARCEPEAPAPQPLEERQTIRLSSAFKAEFVAPILLADHFGEFEAENLDFEFVELGFSDAVTQIASGDIDVGVAGTEAALFNAVDAGIDVRWGLGNFSVPGAGDVSVPQTGLWARTDVFSDPDDPDLSELEGATLASAVGLGSSIAYPIATAFEDAGISVLDMDVEEIPSEDMVQALENDAVQAAWLLDPFWIDAADNPDFTLVATQPPGEPIGGLMFGGHCFDEKRDACEAFARAYVRTVNTYLDGDYQQDDEVMAALAEETGTSEESLAATPSLIFDWEIRERTTDLMQGFFIDFETVEYDEPIPEAEVVDRSLYLAAVGAES
jgi:NitT/TauT family transport system substrate-binding protein